MDSELTGRQWAWGRSNRVEDQILYYLHTTLIPVDPAVGPVEAAGRLDPQQQRHQAGILWRFLGAQYFIIIPCSGSSRCHQCNIKRFGSMPSGGVSKGRYGSVRVGLVPCFMVQHVPQNIFTVSWTRIASFSSFNQRDASPQLDRCLTDLQQ